MRVPHVVVIERTRGLALDLPSLWQYRELLYFLVWRDFKVRYKQTIVGVGWAVLQPVITMIIFTVIFGTLAKMPSDGLPYPIFAYAGLLPWSYFAQAINRGAASLVGNSHLITKVYFPRLIVPLSAIATPAPDFFLSFLVLLGLMSWFQVVPGWQVITLPIFVAFAIVSALATALWLAPLHTKYRDVGYAVPFLVQAWMYASPIMYPSSLVPDRWRALYSLNPMVGAIDGFRWALLGQKNPDFAAMAVSAFVVVALLVAGLFHFKRMERTFSDVI